MSNEKEVIQDLLKEENYEVFRISPLSGGSINRVYLLETSRGKIVLKLNEAGKFPEMFTAEKEGLLALLESHSLDVPKPLKAGEKGKHAFLLLEYKEPRSQKSNFWSLFAEGLAQLHRNTNDRIGFAHSNYIGSLPQYNRWKTSASEFYISERLKPQFKMASENGFDFHNLEVFYKNIEALIPEEPPSLLHGDLWNGNYLSNEKGEPCLIDPAVSYGPREMDLAMMRLFGGFPEAVFSQYHEIFPLAEGHEERTPLWQLYYQLVHLNIFGRSYLPGVQKIVSQFS